MDIEPTHIDELIRRSASGDAVAAEQVLLHFHDPLLKFIRSTLAPTNSTDLSADDLFQETLVEAFRKVRGLQSQGSAAFFGWLKVIARNRHLNRVKAAKALKRRGRIARGHDPDATAMSILPLIAGAGPTASVILRRKEAAGIVANALGKLGADRREVIELRYGQGMSAADVAARLGKSEGAVKMLIHRAIKELREVIAAEHGEFSIGA
jgi:RNA polymerase sigma-70 factor (ECF subfamily)